ncbi:MAG: hypothetical protein SHS37scaffold537_36 [Phage 68_12]|jgi:hypothetical protein|nr:MAG: hypothetical protein SHS37scaffold537_36 [Phage 68_12]
MNDQLEAEKVAAEQAEVDRRIDEDEHQQEEGTA